MRGNLETAAITLGTYAALTVADIVIGPPAALVIASVGLVGLLWLFWRMPV